MPTLKKSADNKPYSPFNFLVTLGGEQGDGKEVVGGFSDVNIPGYTVTYADYRNGNERVNTARKVPMLHKIGDVTLKRGVIGSKDLFTWLNGVAEGTAAPRQVVITLLNQAREPVSAWKLINAQPVSWTGPTLSATATAVAVETVVLCCEGLQYLD